MESAESLQETIVKVFKSCSDMRLRRRDRRNEVVEINSRMEGVVSVRSRTYSTWWAWPRIKFRRIPISLPSPARDKVELFWALANPILVKGQGVFLFFLIVSEFNQVGFSFCPSCTGVPESLANL